MTQTTSPGNRPSTRLGEGSLVEFDFEGETYQATYLWRETIRRGVPTYVVRCEGKVERFSVKSPAGQRLRVAR